MFDPDQMKVLDNRRPQSTEATWHVGRFAPSDRCESQNHFPLYDATSLADEARKRNGNFVDF
jgi:hypothetical protein